MTATCKRCGVELVPGKAIEPFYGGWPDFPGGEVVTLSIQPGPGKLVDVLKCPECGYSVSAGESHG